MATAFNIVSGNKVCRAPVKFLSLEATIGAGKTTQLELIKEALGGRDDVVFLDEPVDEWERRGLLADFYHGRIGTGTFQLMVLMSLAGPLIAAVQKRPSLIIAERSPFSNYHTFAKANLVESELTAYQYTFEELLKAIPAGEIETHMVYLKISPEAALERIKARNRSAEDSVSLAYLRTLHEYHEAMHTKKVSNFFSCVDATLPRDQVFDSIMGYISELLSSSAPRETVDAATVPLHKSGGD